MKLFFVKGMRKGLKLWAILDLNQGPKDYESSALTTELMARMNWKTIYHKTKGLVNMGYRGCTEIIFLYRVVWNFFGANIIINFYDKRNRRTIFRHQFNSDWRAQDQRIPDSEIADASGLNYEECLRILSEKYRIGIIWNCNEKSGDNTIPLRYDRRLSW